MANVINGTDFQLFITSGATKKCIGVATSCKLTIDHAVRNIRSKDDGIWDNNAVGTLSWSVDSEDFFTTDVLGTSGWTYKDLYSYMVARTPVDISLGMVATIGAYPQTLGSSYWSGTGIITKLDLNAPVNDNASFSLSITGTGGLTLT